MLWHSTIWAPIFVPKHEIERLLIICREYCLKVQKLRKILKFSMNYFEIDENVDVEDYYNEEYYE